MGKLDGKVAIVTGAGSGMGRATAIRFAEEGAKVILAEFNETTMTETLNEIITNGGEAIAIKTDVSKEEDVKAMVQKAVDEYGHLDVLANIAGIFDYNAAVENITNELYERVIGVNMTGPLYACREAVKVFKEQGTGGSIVNVSSIGGLFGARGGVAYTMSKHGIIGLTKSIAAHYGLENTDIRANAVSPGYIKTAMTASVKEHGRDPIGGKVSAQLGSTLAGEPEDIANAVLFLASDDSKFINGAILTVDGSWTVR